MTRPARRRAAPSARPPARRPGRGRLARLGLVLAATLGVLPLLTVEVALQDMASLLDGPGSNARWQAFFVPAPAGSIEAAKLAFADPAVAGRLPEGVGIAAGSGERFSVDTVRKVYDTPDEARISRGDKTGRVLAVTPFAPPKAFTAGSILERQSLLRPAVDDIGVETAFAGPDGAGDLVQLAMNFEPARADPLPEAAPAVMLASFGPRGSAPSAVPAAVATALGYAEASAGNRISTLFDRILTGRKAAFVPPIGAADHAWAATPLPASAYTAREQTCLAKGIYFEARGESQTGQAAVAQVILNRVRNPTYPKTICGVVYQNKTWRNRCQFSFACDGIRDRIASRRAYATARLIARQVTDGDIWLPEVGSATHYHATYVKPRWASAMEKVDKIGHHIFYRTFGGGWD